METTRFVDEAVTLGGVVGETVEVPSANPVNYYQAINDPDGCESIVIDGKLFLHDTEIAQAVVMVVPGSLGVGPNHLGHGDALLAAEYSVLVLDPFGARAVQSTVANQTHYSFAASAFDVLAALAVLRADSRVDGERIAAQGHSRGGSAVLTASMRRFADAVAGPDVALAGVYAVYPWCGHMFTDPDVGPTRVRAIVGDQDDWLSPQQVQAQAHAIRAAGGDATVEMVVGAGHSFDRHQEIELLGDARVAPGAPTVFVGDDGAMASPLIGPGDGALTDYDVFVAAIKAGHGRHGAHIGATGQQPDVFGADMLAFHASVLG